MFRSWTDILLKALAFYREVVIKRNAEPQDTHMHFVPEMHMEMTCVYSAAAQSVDKLLMRGGE